MTLANMTILAYFDKPMSTYLSSLFINSLKLIVFGTLYKYSGINFFLSSLKMYYHALCGAFSEIKSFKVAMWLEKIGLQSLSPIFEIKIITSYSKMQS
jgi:hypothetical protein